MATDLVTPQEQKQAKLAESPTALYRHFDAQGNLLYIGIAANVTARTIQHSKNSAWARSMSHLTIEHFDNRKDAMLAEAEAIRREKPLHNIVHAGPGIAATRYEIAKQELVRSVVFKTTYDTNALSNLLSVSVGCVAKLHRSGELGYIEITNRRLSTGWQVIDFLESCEGARYADKVKP